MPDLPRITIGLTCYNAEDTVARALASAQGQHWDDLEIIVVDDCSTDGSRRVLERIAAEDNRIKLIFHDTNRGFPAALNTILKHSGGDYVAFFDDDDVSQGDRLQTQWQRLSSYQSLHPAVPVFCYANRAIVRANETEASHTAYAIGRHPDEPYGDIVAEYIFLQTGPKRFCWGLFGSCTLFAARQGLLALGGFDENFRRSAEWDLAIRAALQGAHFIAADAPLITQYKTRTPDKAGTTPLLYRQKLVEKHRDFLKSRGLYRASLLLAHAHFIGNKGNIFLATLYKLAACAISPGAYLLRLIRYRLRLG